MNSEELLLQDPGPTEIPLPDGLKNYLRHFGPGQLSRRVYVFMGSFLLPRPGEDYQIDAEKLTIPHPIKTLEIISLVIPVADERWYYSHDDGWSRL